MLEMLTKSKIIVLSTLICIFSSAFKMSEFIPVHKETNEFSIYVSESKIKSNKIQALKNPDFTTTSILADGDIYKISIEEDGIHQITYDMLSELMDMTGIDPRQIKIYGHPAGPLSEGISDGIIDDLIEITVMIAGEDDGTFDTEDRILFYAQGPDRTSYDADDQQISIEKNVYSRESFYFIKTTGERGLRIPMQANVTNTDATSITSDAIAYIGESKINLLGSYANTQGSGQLWFDRIMSNQRLVNFSSDIDLSKADVSSPVSFDLSFAGRSESTSEVILSVDDTSYQSSIGRVRTGDVEATYARLTQINELVNIKTTTPQVIVEYPGEKSSSEGWLDYLSIQFRQKLETSGTELHIVDFQSVEHDTYGHEVISSASQNTMIWDITDPLQAIEQSYEKNGETVTFGYDSEILRHFIHFSPTMDVSKPSAITKIENQNLHGISEVELVIIYHPDFAASAELLADHRRTHDGLTVRTVDVNLIYNEFSAGKQDPTAIRNFAKMLYDRSSGFKFLLLIGDGSYDYLGVSPELSNQSFIPPYETKESLNPLTAFPTDDYYALLSDNEGQNLKGAIDIAVGRIPVKTKTEADQVINKIISYDTDPNRFGDWRLRLAFSADDEDSNIHLKQADGIASKTENKHTVFNQEKIYFDAFIQESTPGGARYPEANTKLNNEILNGLLVSNYMGHGGPRGWSQERVLKISDIRSWKNQSKLPLIITATCSFTGFDDPALVTAGEEAILNPNGGAVALFSTVRSVYSSQNERLTRSVYDTLFTKDNGEYLAIGETLRRAKNANSADTINVNARKFLLIGDPSMKLALPKHEINTLSINQQEVSKAIPDTINALEEVTIEGEVIDNNGERLTDFNGVVTTTLYDKSTNIKTLQNDKSSFQREFKVRRNRLFRGTATVVDGYFTSTFVIPIDIDYDFGNGKLSYYATDNSQADAAGFYNNLIIGGTSDEIILDDEPPVIAAYLNTYDFTSGDRVNPDPILLVNLSDDKGINFTGTSIGHDITAIIDGNTQNTLILNDFYLGDLDNAAAGRISFPIKDLSPGEHSIEIQAFDVANNPAKIQITFIVIGIEESTVDGLTAMPNPTDQMTTFSYSHSFANENVTTELSIYDLSGRLVKTIVNRAFSSSSLTNEIEWDGTDDSGNQVNSGIYLYQVKINSPSLNISKESSFEKIVIVK